MATLKQATDALVGAMRDGTEIDDDLIAVANAFQQACHDSDGAGIDAAFTQLGLAFGDGIPTLRMALVATICGAWVEDGRDPETFARPLIGVVRDLVRDVGGLCRLCDQKMPDEIGVDEDGDEIFVSIRDKLIAEDTSLSGKWEILGMMYLPAIAAFAKSARLRREYQTMLPDLMLLNGRHMAGDYLSMMLRVPDNERLLVLEPGAGRGFLGRMSGIADNFQLHMLLSDMLPLPNGSPSFSPEKIAHLRGALPYHKEEDVFIGRWNMFSWKAAAHHGCLPTGASHSSCWIWNEGIPDHIPTFDGMRVVLLGEPSYQRAMSHNIIFGNLPADITVDEWLSADQVDVWFERLKMPPLH